MNATNSEKEIRFPRLANSPILESVLHIRCGLDVLFLNGNDTVTRLTKVLAPSNLHHVGPIKQLKIEQTIGKLLPDEPKAIESYLGERFESNDKKQIVQVFRDGISVSWMNPYPDWDSFSRLALASWRNLQTVAGGVPSIVRIGLRAINRIILVDGMSSIDRYFIGGHARQLRDGYPGTLVCSGFLSCDSVFDPDNKVSANITRTIQPPMASSKGCPVLLYDIDTFVLPSASMTSEEVEEKIQCLHSFRNRIFFSEMSQKAIEEFL